MAKPKIKTLEQAAQAGYRYERYVNGELYHWWNPAGVRYETWPYLGDCSCPARGNCKHLDWSDTLEMLQSKFIKQEVAA